MGYIANETITPTGSDDTFTLANDFEAGTVLINYDGFIFYAYREEAPDKVVFDFEPPVGANIKVSYYTAGQGYSLNAARYIVPKQVIAKSRIADLSSANEADIEKLIRDAEVAIDSYIGKYHKFYTQNNGQSLVGQKLKFPRDIDDLSTENLLSYVGILEDITDSVFYVVENLFLQGEPEEATDVDGTLVSESLGDYSYKKKEGKGSDKDFAYNAILGTKAKLILDKFRNMSARPGEMKIRGDFENIELLNSRQRFRLTHKCD